MENRPLDVTRMLFGLAGIGVVVLLDEMDVISIAGSTRDGLFYYLGGGALGVVVYEIYRRAWRRLSQK